MGTRYSHGKATNKMSIYFDNNTYQRIWKLSENYGIPMRIICEIAVRRQLSKMEKFIEGEDIIDIPDMDEDDKI